MAITPDGRYALSGSRDKTLGYAAHRPGVAVLPAGRLAVSGGEGSTVRLRDLESGLLVRTLNGHTEGVQAVVALPDGRTILSGAKDNTLRVWTLP